MTVLEWIRKMICGNKDDTPDEVTIIPDQGVFPRETKLYCNYCKNITEFRYDNKRGYVCKVCDRK